MSDPGVDDGFLRAVFDGGADAILVVDRDGVIAVANASAHAMLGLDALVGQSVEDLLADSKRAAHRKHREVFNKHGVARQMGSGLDLMARRGDGSFVPVDIALSPVEIGGETYTVASMRDVTAIVETRRELEASESQLAIMKDRERIARDLHDTVIQDIFAAGLSLQAMQSGSSDPVVVQRVGAAVEQLDAAITRLRRVIFDLRARTGEDITATIERVVARLVNGSGVEASVHWSGPPEALSARVTEHLVATIREAVANVVRHAEAKHARIDVGVADGRCVVEVADDGRGLGQSAGVGFGLDNMANRAAALGGGFSFAERESGGAIVTWWAPLIDVQAQRRAVSSTP